MLAYLQRHHMGLIALFVALGGTSYAATQLPPDSVGKRQIRTGAVTATKIQNGAITSAKLSRALNALLRSSHAGAMGPTGSSGAAGPAGPAAALAYGYYPRSQPCVPAPEIACPAITAPRIALSRAVNVSLANQGAGGFVCLAPGPDIDPSNAVVITAPTGGPNGTSVTAIDHADWIPDAPNCAPGQIEVDTYYVTSNGSGQHVTRIGLPFAFVIF